LILIGVLAFEETPPARAFVKIDTGIMTGGDPFRAQTLGPAQQGAELDAPIAPEAGIGSSPSAVLINEIGNHRPVECPAEIGDIKRDSEYGRDPAGIPAGAGPAAAPENVGDADGLREGEEIHRHPEDVEPLIPEQGRRYGRIDAAAHGRDHRPRTGGNLFLHR
jgi:hypothetical protein